jgi:hypothetical protein
MIFSFDFPFLLLVGLFVAQVAMTSFYSPWEIGRYYRQLVDKYPPAEYPRLYPESPDALEGKQTILRRLNALIGAVGLLAILASLLFWKKDMANQGLRDFLHPLFVISTYCGIQVVPALIYARWRRLAAKRLREMGAPTRRSATLRRLKITDYISPALVLFGLASTATAFILSAYWLASGMGPRDVMIMVTVASALFLSLMLHRVLWAPQFKRTDPFMSQDDLFRQRNRRMRALFRACGICALLFLFIAAARVGVFGFDINLSFVFAIPCLLFIAQALSLPRSLARMLEQRDFSVYRAPHSN